MTIGAKFSFDIKVGEKANILRTGHISQMLPRAGAMVINSHQFDSLSECEHALNRAMAHIARHESQAAEKNYVLVAKSHPLSSNQGGVHADAASWEDTHILRVYLADAEQLKLAQLKYHTFGQIKVG